MSADPIDQLIASGATARELIAYPLDAIEWLAQHQRETFRLCYHDEAGAVVVENIKAAQLLRRAAELGWGPHGESLYSEAAMSMFDNAVYHVRRGVHWYASATDDSCAMLPLAWPAATLARNAAREQREDAAWRRRNEADKRRKEREKRKAARMKRRDNLHRIALSDVARAEKAGKPISYRTARRQLSTLLNEVAEAFRKRKEETAAVVSQPIEGDK